MSVEEAAVSELVDRAAGCAGGDNGRRLGSDERDINLSGIRCGRLFTRGQSRRCRRLRRLRYRSRFRSYFRACASFRSALWLFLENFKQL